MDKTKSLQETQYNNYNKNDQKSTLQNPRNVKIRKDAGEPNKPPNIKEIDKNNVTKTYQNHIKLYPVQADCGDSVITKIDKEDTERTLKDGLIKRNKEIHSDKFKLRKTNVNFLPDARHELVITKNNEIVKHNTDLPITKANPIIDAKYGHKTTKKVPTKGHEADKCKPIGSKLNNNKDVCFKDTIKPFTSHNNINEEKATKYVAPDVKVKKNPKIVSLLVKIPKSVSNCKVQNNESVDYNNSKNIAQLRAPSETNKRKGHDKPPHINKYLKKNKKESNFRNEHGQKKVHNYFQMYRWTRNTIAMLSNQNNNSQKLVQNTSLEDINQKTIKSKSIKDSIKKDGSKLSFRKGKSGLKRNSKMERCKRTNKVPTESPDRVVSISSPQTEVAKWAPNSIDKHTKLYYEAWVNTTLTAVSKSKPKIPPELPNRIKDFQKYLEEQIKSPVQMHKDYKDKRFVGTIKVNHRKKL